MLTMAYDGSGRRVSKTRYSKACVSDEADGVYAADWERELVTHYTGIGTEVRESFHNGTPSETKVVVNMPQGLGRYGVEDAEKPSSGNATFEWYLKNHLGSTMLVYGTQSTSNADVADLGEVKKAYDYRSFGEQIDLIADAGDKVTENFTGKERDDETELNYFGARYLDPMLGLWISVDPKRQFASPYLYVGNGMNPISAVDSDGNEAEESSNNECQTVLERIWNAAVGVIHSAIEWVKVEAQSFDVLRKETVSRPSGANVDVENVQRAQKNVHKGVQVLPKEVMKGSVGKVIGIGVDAVIGAAKDDGENSLEPVQRPTDFDDFGQEDLNSLWNQ